MNTRDIKVRIQAIDGYRTTRVFKTLAGASKFAQSHLGKYPGIMPPAAWGSGAGWATSDDGIVTAKVSGATLQELFPDPPALPTHWASCGCCKDSEWEPGMGSTGSHRPHAILPAADDDGLPF
jgi:hypothetical protein